MPKELAKHALLDAIIQHERLANDAELSSALELDRGMVSRIRNNKQDVSDGVRLAIIRKFRWHIERIDELAPPRGKL